jgi:hypothetical protein
VQESAQRLLTTNGNFEGCGSRARSYSKTTSAGSLSSRHPRNVVCRNSPSRVHSAKATSQTNAGFTHWIFSGTLGGFTNGDLSVKNGFSRSTASFNPFSVKPLPECPKYRSFPFRYAHNSSAPKCLRLPYPSVKPHRTNSCCGRALIFNQSGDRFPGR